MPRCCSTSILRYLCDTRPVDASGIDWYPLDPRARALVNARCDFYHASIRPGAAGVFKYRVLLPRMGVESPPACLKEAWGVLRYSLSCMDSLLRSQEEAGATSTDLAGLGHPTIADLLPVAELAMLETLPEAEWSVRAMSAKYPAVGRWYAAMHDGPPLADAWFESEAMLRKAVVAFRKTPPLEVSASAKL